MTQTIILLALAAIFYSAFFLFVDKASVNANGYFSSFIFNGLGAIVPLVVYFFLRQAKKMEALPTTGASIGFAVAAGLSLSAFSIVLFRLFARGSGVSYAVPVIYGGTIILTTLLGALFLKESVPPLHLAGVLLITLGVGLVIASKI
jgi:uncharacterized membrane protein